METAINRAGYLRESYHYFHLRDTAGQELDFHFHEFDKLIILISGKVDYRVESSSYELHPWDVLLVGHHTIHKAEIDKTNSAIKAEQAAESARKTAEAAKKAAEEAAKDRLSFLNIDRPETQFEPEHDMYAPDVYQMAHDMLWQQVSQGIYCQDETACYYLYELTMDGRSQTGLVACASIDDYANGIIKKHENTRAENE